MNEAYRLWRFLQDRVVGTVAALTLLGATLIAIVEIFRRYVIGQSFPWGQDVVTYFITAAAFLYFGATQARRAHLAVTMLPDALRERGHERAVFALRAIRTAVSLLFVAGFFYWGWPAAVRTWEIGRTSPSLLLPLAPFNFILLFGVASMGVTMLFQLYREVQAIRGRRVLPDDPDEEGFEL